VVLSIPNLEFPEGIYWIQGVNGSGKSTLLKSIAGIIPFEGKISVNGFDLKKDPIQARKKVTFSEAEPVFPVFLTGMEIVAFVARTRGIENEDRDLIMDYFGIGDFKDQAIGGYSAGMLKKLSLSLAFQGNSRWILLDEPLAFIDQETEKLLIKRIIRKKEEGTGIILTSHHALNSSGIRADRIFRIRDDRLIEEV